MSGYTHLLWNLVLREVPDILGVGSLSRFFEERRIRAELSKLHKRILATIDDSTISPWGLGVARSISAV